MFVRSFCSGCFLQNVFGTQPFADYCQQRGIAFGPEASGEQGADLRRWVAAFTQLPQEKQAQVELELATVRDLAEQGAITQLLAGLEGKAPPPDSVPGDTALALWFFVRHPALFHEVFLHHETDDAETWWNARAAPDVSLQDLPAKAASLAAGLRGIFQRRDGTGRFCAVDGRQLNGAFCFAAHVADRLQFLEVFTEGGEYATQPLQPALPLVFVYYPLDGTILIQTRLQSRERVSELLHLFAQVVLGAELEHLDREEAFHLDRLKERFDPLPDAEDMEMVRVKALHLRYPERQGRRQVRLETLTSDEQFAIVDMIRAHLAHEGVLRHLRVAHAELQLKLRAEGGTKNYVIRLWPNRSSLNHTALHERFRTCLKQWGLYAVHGREG